MNFFKQKRTTIILVNRYEVLRADFSGRNTNPIVSTRAAVEPDATLAEAVESVVTAGHKVSGDTLIFWDSLWTQILELPKSSLRNVSDEELREALKFEAETLSGVMLDNIELSQQPLASEKGIAKFWVMVGDRNELSDAQLVCESLGAEAVSFGHPAGHLNDPTATGQEEIWGSQQFLFDSQLASIQPVMYSAESVSKDEEPRCFKKWFEQAFLQHLDSSNSLPRICLAEKNSKQLAPFVAVALALTTLAACVWHYQFVQTELSSHRAKIEDLKKPALEKKNFDSQMTALLQKRNDLEVKSREVEQELKRIQFFMEDQTDRYLDLLRLLAQYRTQDLVVKRIVGTQDGVQIEGVSLASESAQVMASRLRESTGVLGWATLPPQQEGRQKLSNGGPWDYEILLSDSGPLGFQDNSRRITQASTSKVRGSK